jgi:hypothetical protein
MPHGFFETNYKFHLYRTMKGVIMNFQAIVSRVQILWCSTRVRRKDV